MTGLSEARGLAVMGCLPCTACGDFSEVCEWLGAVSRSGGPWGGAPARLVVRRPTGFGRGCQRAFEHGGQRAFEHGGQRRTGFVARPGGHPNGGLCGTQQRQPCAAPRPLPLRYRSAPRPRGAPRGGLRGGEGNQADTNKKPDHVTRFATRSSLQISPVERLSKSGVIHTPSRESNSSRSYYKGRSPCI